MGHSRGAKLSCLLADQVCRTVSETLLTLHIMVSTGYDAAFVVAWLCLGPIVAWLCLGPEKLCHYMLAGQGDTW